MPRGDKTGPMGSGPMTGRRMGTCAGSGTEGSFPRRGRGLGLGLLGFGIWLVRLWVANRQPAEIRPRAKDNEVEELRKEIAEKEGAISELKQRLRAAEGENKYL
jgi:hypothetical protein